MKKAVVDSVLKSAVAKVAEEVAALVGEEFKLSDPQYATLTKAEFFETPREKCAHTRLKASGDGLESEAAVILPLKDAIQLGGTLIMLPDDELAEKIKNPDLQGEEGDAFGEIANILAGSITSTFEELFPKKLHFVKTSCENLIPTKVDMESVQPFAPGHYHVTSTAMSLAGKPLGNLELIFPFSLLGLPIPEETSSEADAPKPEEASRQPTQKEVEAEQADEKAAARQTEGTSAEEKQAAARVTADDQREATSADTEAKDAAPSEGETPPAAEKKPVARNVVDNVLDSAFKEIAKDLTDLIGRPIQCAGPSFTPITKEEYLALPREKGALAHMVASGDTEGKAFINVRQKDAIFLGGTLIMLPEDELATKVKACNFEGEEGDAYGEVANIITGSLAKVFGELYPRSLHFKRTDVEPLIPTKVDPDSDEPFAPGEYYLATCKLALEGKALGELDLLFPTGVLNIRIEAPSAERSAAEDGKKAAQGVEVEGEKEQKPKATSTSSISSDDLAALQAAAMTSDGNDEEQGPQTVIVLGESDEASSLLAQVLEENSIPHKILQFQDNIKQNISASSIAGVFIVMEKVDEQGFATAIKAKSAIEAGIPLIMAGPEWTRSAVLKAVRYGACDILVTPASPKEITEKVERHISPASAH